MEVGRDMPAAAEEEGLTAADALEEGRTDETGQRRAGPGRCVHLDGPCPPSSGLRAGGGLVSRGFGVTSLCSHWSTSAADVHSHERSA
jgi:hypothetical protein